MGAFELSSKDIFLAHDPNPATPRYTPNGYRSEIDGLRAIAVLSVVLYHFGVPGLTGGFVGVDIFFVISGFLIGGILWREHSTTGKISILRFYVRRFKRLAPAYFAMAIATFVAAWFILLPFEFREFGKSLIAATVYLSNVFFWRSSGYFDSGAEDKVLLHTWSLAVEEQFYVFLPLILLIILRWRRRVPVILAALALASLAACVSYTKIDQPGAFYLFPFRAWELLAGVLLAIWGQETRTDWRGSAARSWLGLVLIIASVLIIQPNDQFPGMVAVLPVLGTALIIGSGRSNSFVNRLLRARIMVGIGLISYSLYLWHWPVFTLAHYYFGGLEGWGMRIALIALSFVLAYLSWLLVERPVRRAAGMPVWAVFSGVVVSSAILIGLGGLLYKQGGLPDRFGPDAKPHIMATADFLQDFSRCTVPANGPWRGIELCPIGPEGEPRALIWGDSHVRAFKEGLEQVAWETDTPALIIWRAGCAPLFGLEKTESAATPAQNAACTAANNQIRAALPEMPSLDKLLLIGRWAYYAEGRGIGRDADNTIAIKAVDGDSGGDQVAVLKHAAEQSMLDLLNHFDEVFVLRQVPEVPEYDSRYVAREMAHGRLDAAGASSLGIVSEDDLAERSAAADAPFVDLRREGVITWIDLWPRMCGARLCSALQGSTGFYFDNNHLTNEAARSLRDAFRPVFTPDYPMQDAAG